MVNQTLKEFADGIRETITLLESEASALDRVNARRNQKDREEEADFERRLGTPRR